MDTKLQITKVCTITLNNEAEIVALIDILENLDIDEIMSTSEQLYEDLIHNLREMIK